MSSLETKLAVIQRCGFSILYVDLLNTKTVECKIIFVEICQAGILLYHVNISLTYLHIYFVKKIGTLILKCKFSLGGPLWKTQLQ